MLNRFPYNNGHLLHRASRHKGNLSDLNASELLEVMETLRRMVSVLDRLMHPDGYNIGLNLGRGRRGRSSRTPPLARHSALAWRHEFYALVGDTKVIVQSLGCLI